MICGGSGMALIASGPFGLIIGGILGIIMSKLLGGVVKGKAKKTARTLNAPRWLVKMRITDAKIEQMRCDFAKQCKDAVEKPLSEMKASLLEKITMVVQEEIDALTYVDQVLR